MTNENAIRSKQKFKSLPVLKAVIQLAAFLLFPGFFITVFSSLKTIYTAVIGGTATLSGLAGPIVLTVTVLLFTALMGRFFCGFLCSFGAMGDLMWFLGTKLHLPRPRIGENADRVLKYLKYVLLAVLVIGVWTFELPLFTGTNDPWTVFGMYTTIKGWSDLAGLFSVGGLLLLVILLGSLFVDRFFCRYLCPLGGIFALLSKGRLFRIRKPREKCGTCRACTRRCPMAIPLYQTDVIRSGECIDCFNCANVCPRNNVSADPKPAVSALIAAGALTGMFYAGTLTDNLAGGTMNDTSAVSSESTGIYTDGVYTGSGSGFRGTTSVSVTVRNGNISSVTVTSYADDDQFFNKAKNTVISEILKAQDTDVDTVSGATFSSKGIISAVADALSGALRDTSGSSEASSVSSESSSSAASSSVSSSTSSSASSSAASSSTSVASSASSAASSAASSSSASLGVADGVYTGSGTGLRGTTSVSVTVSGGKIQSVTVTSYADDSKFFNMAENTVIGEIISNQSVNVSTVSGATFSSNGILEAVANALGLDFDNPNSSMSQGGHSFH